MQDHSWIRYLKKIKPYNIQKGLRYLKHYGPREFWVRLCERMEPEEVPYGPWFEKHRPALEELEHQRKKKWKNIWQTSRFRAAEAQTIGRHLPISTA